MQSREGGCGCTLVQTELPWLSFALGWLAGAQMGLRGPKEGEYHEVSMVGGLGWCDRKREGGE